MLYTLGTIFLVVIVWNAGKNRKVAWAATFAFLAGIALWFEPTPALDLYRHYETLDTFRNVGYGATVEKYQNIMGDLPVYALLFYGISLLGNNKLLLVFTYYVVYGCMLSVLSMYIEDEKLSNKHWRIGYAVIMLTTNAYALTGIRNMLAFAVVCLFMYIDLRRKKMRILSMVMYVLMCLLHNSITVFVVLRILMYFSRYKGYKVVRFSVVLWPLVQDRIVAVLGNSPIQLLASASDKLVRYSTQEAAERWVGGLAAETLSLVKFVFMAVIVLYYLRMEKTRREEPYIQMLLLTVLFSLGGIGSPALADRYTNMAIMYAIPFLVSNSGTIEVKGANGLTICRNSFPLWILVIGYFLCLFLFRYRIFI